MGRFNNPILFEVKQLEARIDDEALTPIDLEVFLNNEDWSVWLIGC